MWSVSYLWKLGSPRKLNLISFVQSVLNPLASVCWVFISGYKSYQSPPSSVPHPISLSLSRFHSIFHFLLLYDIHCCSFPFTYIEIEFLDSDWNYLLLAESYDEITYDYFFLLCLHNKPQILKSLCSVTNCTSTAH